MNETGHDPGTVVRLKVPLSDPRGFVALYHRESEMILTFCSRRVLDAEAAVDLTAETFAQAFASRRGFRGISEVEARAWLLTIARRPLLRHVSRYRTTRSKSGAIRRKLLGRTRRCRVPERIVATEAVTFASGA